MTKIKQALLAGMVLVVMEAGPALAHDRDNCFSQKTGDGYIKLCSDRDGVIRFALHAYGDDDRQDNRRNIRYDWNEHEHRAKQHKTVAHHYYGLPPGIAKKYWKHDHYRKGGHHKCRYHERRGHRH